MMTSKPSALLAVLAALALWLAPAPASAPKPEDEGRIALSVANWLQQAHYSRKKLDDAMSAKLLATYLELLDYNRLYFTQEDVDEFTKKYATTLDDAILRGDLSPARDIFQRFQERVESRVQSNKKLVASAAGALAETTTDIDKPKTEWSVDPSKADKTWRERVAANLLFQGNATVELNRQKSPWPKNLTEADKLWRDRVEAELLQEELSELKLRTPAETLNRRYDQVLRNVRDMAGEEVVSTFLKALAQSYDPHSDYMSPSEMENFQINMKLSLVGIGAVLRSEDGYAKIMELVPGGPADKDGRLKVGDRIVAVAQGDKDFEDVVDMKLDKVVEKIRGEKNSIVRLQVIPTDADDPSKRTVIDITRDKVALKDQEAKAELLDVSGPDGKVTRIGWISLPSFYANMSGSGEPKSTTTDVSALLERLKKENIEGLVIDLRRDGGGSLEEAINLTGLFIESGPVVLAKDSSGNITKNLDKNPEVAYTGPMVVVMNRLSASASEIFAAAMQDYGRAVVVGDERSFGKGTVQTVVDLDRAMSLPFFGRKSPPAGAVKLTIQKFYRISGGSTQLNGVESDIILPSRTDNPEIGESALKNPLPYDEVAPVAFKSSPNAGELFLEELRERSQRRIASDPEFAYVSEDMRRLRERIEKNSISTNKELRKKELAEDKARKEARKTERLARGPLIDAKVWELTLDDVKNNRETLEVVAYERRRDKKYSGEESDDPEESGDSEEGAEKKDKTPEPDPIRNESVRIITDLIEFSNLARTASAKPAPESPAKTP
jgi:carboxyl-terminal processing protease